MEKVLKVLLSIWTMLAILLTLTLNNAIAAADKPIELKFADHLPTTSYAVDGSVTVWLNQIEKVTNGRVKVIRYPMQTLVKAADIWEAIKTGVADMGWVVPGYLPGMFLLSQVITLPALPITSAEESAAISWKLYEKFPEIQSEFKDVKVLTLCNSGPYLLNTSKKLVQTYEDLKGMKIRVLAGIGVDQLKTLGAVPVMMPMGDVYVALERGVLDAVSTPWEAIYYFKNFEVAKYVTCFPLSGTANAMPINLKKWNSFPPDIQKAIMSVSGLEGSKSFSRGYYDRTGESHIVEQCKKAGTELVIYKPPKEELKKWEAIGGRPIWDEWVKKMESKGYSKAREILNETIKLAEEWK